MVAVIMVGATGAVGGEAFKALRAYSGVERITTLGRRSVGGVDDARVRQNIVDLAKPEGYRHHLSDHSVAICTLGVGEPSKVSKEEFKRIDHDLVLTFAAACAAAGVQHFQLLSSVGTNARSPIFYLRMKGQLEESLRALGFQRLSLFHPSVILTPTNRYGLSQAITLRAWPWLTPVLQGGMRRYRGVPVETLGQSMAANALTEGHGLEVLEWGDFQRLASTRSD